MIVRFGLAPRAAGLTPQECQQHWRTTHAESAAQIPHLVSYVQNHAVLRDGVALLPYPGFDVLSEIEFRSLDEMDRAFASDVFQGAVRDDEKRLIDPTRHFAVLTERAALIGERSDDAQPKLLAFLRAAPGIEPDALIDTLVGPYADALARDGAVTGLEVLRVGSELHEDRPPAPCDAVTIARYGSIDEAVVALASPERAVAERELAGLCFGRADVLAQAVRIL